jgi:YVTN family beta-propeller protein
VRWLACLLVLLAAVPSAEAGGSPVALVAAGNRVLAVALPSGQVLRSIPVPATDVATSAGASAVAGPHSLAVLRGLRVARIRRGLEPRAVAFAPLGERLYVTSGSTLSVIDTASGKVAARVPVGRGAGRIAVDPGGNRVWVVLPHAIATLDVAEGGRPRLEGRIPVAASDLAFAQDGLGVWVARAHETDLLDAATHRVVRRLPAARRIAVGPRGVVLADGPVAAAGGLVVRVATGVLTERDGDGRVLLRTVVPRATTGVAVAVLP